MKPGNIGEGSAPRLQQMDGLRGIAMLFVFMGHFAPLWNGIVPAGMAGFFLKVVEADATLGSSFFMLLSGFFSYGSLVRGQKSFAEFMRGRLWRLYPLYLVIILVYVAGSILIPELSKLPADPRDATLFLLQTLFFLSGLLRTHRILIDVSWMLSFVILFYFIEAALVRLFRFLDLSRTVRFAVLAGAGIVWAWVGDSKGWWEARTVGFWVGMAASELIGGMTGERLAWAQRMTRPAVVVTCLGLFIRTGLMIYRPDTGIVSLLICRAAITSVTLSAFLWCAYYGPLWWKRALSAPQLLKLGQVSYSFYLTHGFAIKAFRYGIIPWIGLSAGAPVIFWASQLIGLALAIKIAKAAYVLVESPLSKLDLRRLRDYCGALAFSNHT